MLAFEWSSWYGWFVAVGGGIGIVLVFAQFFGLLGKIVRSIRDFFGKPPSEADIRIAVKDVLGNAHGRGEYLHSHPEQRPAEEWVTYVHNFIASALGEGEAALFLSDAGYTFYASQHDTRVKIWIEGRLRRLADMIARIDVLTIKPTFDHRSVPSPPWE
jgi:hypothetical protein